jgi:hypothetical protein
VERRHCPRVSGHRDIGPGPAPRTGIGVAPRGPLGRAEGDPLPQTTRGVLPIDHHGSTGSRPLRSTDGDPDDERARGRPIVCPRRGRERGRDAVRERRHRTFLHRRSGLSSGTGWRPDPVRDLRQGKPERRLPLGLDGGGLGQLPPVREGGLGNDAAGGVGRPIDGRRPGVPSVVRDPHASRRESSCHPPARGDGEDGRCACSAAADRRSDARDAPDR